VNRAPRAGTVSSPVRCSITWIPALNSRECAGPSRQIRCRQCSVSRYPPPSPQPAPGGGAHSAHPADLIRIADALWPVFAETAPERKAELTNSLLSLAGLEPILDPTGHLAWRTRNSDALHGLHASVLLTILASAQVLGWDRLGTCNAEDCVDVYFDDGRRAPRIYCTTKCLNRTRIRAFRARTSHPPV
jgi:hypothetical protein